MPALTDRSDGPPMDRILATISDRVAQSLVSHLSNFQEQGSVTDNARMKLQGLLCPAGVPDNSQSQVLDLGFVDAGELASLLHAGQRDNSKVLSDCPPSTSPQRAVEIEVSSCSQFPQTPPTSSSDEIAQSHHGSLAKRRKVVGGLRLLQCSSISRPNNFAAFESAAEEDENYNATRSQVAVPRQLQSDVRNLPQRKKALVKRTSSTPRSASTFVASIWKTIYGSIRMQPPAELGEYEITRLGTNHVACMNREAFNQINAVCLKASMLGRSARALEIIVQAHWMDCYDKRIKTIAVEDPCMSPTESKMAGLHEACTALGWTEKELRNRMTIWHGYQDIKDAGGWASLVFAGSGIYSTCKYRIGFEDGLLQRLSKLRVSIEVAADTLHPQWRRFLIAIGHDTRRVYTGHAHDWVIRAEKAALPLASTYRQWDPAFSFRHVDDCIIDDCWQGHDPRRQYEQDCYVCSECEQAQSNDPQTNKCACFPFLVAGAAHAPAPVQVGRCPRGRNNGLFARCGFERGTAVGQFVGLITKGIEGVDVMMGGQGDKEYQIYQGRVGNYTRFINHSCVPNAQFAKFLWCGVERVIVVSKGIDPGMEVTVDYSPSYWTNLEKICLCGELCCRYVGSERRKHLQT